MNISTTSITGDTSTINASKAPNPQRIRLETKIAYIESQIDALPGFLPESYQYLMAQLDQQQHQLLAILLQDHFDAIDATLPK